MKITADTNLLVRIITYDDPIQARQSAHILDGAEVVYIPLPCLCEFAWVLDGIYGLSRDQIGSSIRSIVQRQNVESDLAAVSAGLHLLDAGGDFADGVIAATGLAMGSETFVSFDRKAIARLQTAGFSTLLASSFK